MAKSLKYIAKGFLKLPELTASLLLLALLLILL